MLDFDRNLYKYPPVIDDYMVFAIEKTGIKYKKKKWIQIQSPKLFGEKVVGETLVGEVDKMLGSTVLVSVGQLTGNVKKQNLIVTLKITGFDGDKAKTDIKEFKLEKSYIARLVKKRASQLTDSFTAESPPPTTTSTSFPLYNGPSQDAQ